MTLFIEKCPLLQKGDKGPDIADLQRRLRREDFDLKVDGYFGPKTRLAVKLYQKGQRLKEDGIMGPKTWAQFEDTG